MIKGLGREKGVLTAVSIVILIVNIFIALYAVSTIIGKGPDGKLMLTAKVISLNYYLLLALNLIFGAVSMWFIKYTADDARWGARLFAALLVPAFMVFYTVNLSIFSWEDFLAMF